MPTVDFGPDIKCVMAIIRKQVWMLIGEEPHHRHGDNHGNEHCDWSIFEELEEVQYLADGDEMRAAHTKCETGEVEELREMQGRLMCTTVTNHYPAINDDEQRKNHTKDNIAPHTYNDVADNLP